MNTTWTSCSSSASTSSSTGCPPGYAEYRRLLPEVAMEPVFAPGVPVGVRRLYEHRPELFVAADAARPRRQTSWSVAPGNTFGTLLVWLAVCVGGWILALIVMAATLPTAVAAWAAVVLAGIAVLSTGGIVVKSMVEDRGHKAVRLQHGKYLLPEDFDEAAA